MGLVLVSLLPSSNGNGACGVQIEGSSVAAPSSGTAGGVQAGVGVRGKEAVQARAWGGEVVQAGDGAGEVVQAGAGLGRAGGRVREHGVRPCRTQMWTGRWKKKKRLTGANCTE